MDVPSTLPRSLFDGYYRFGQGSNRDPSDFLAAFYDGQYWKYPNSENGQNSYGFNVDSDGNPIYEQVTVEPPSGGSDPLQFSRFGSNAGKSIPFSSRTSAITAAMS